MKPLNDKQLLKLAEYYSANETCLFLNGRVRELKTELGKKEAYIIELEERVKRCQSDAMRESLKSIKQDTKKEEMYQNLQHQLKIALENNLKLRKQNQQNAQTIYQLNQKLNETKRKHKLYH